MGHFLVCINLECHFLLDCRKDSEDEHSSFHHVPTCPKCGRLLSRQCPFCLHVLEVTWTQETAHCSNCRRELNAAAT